MQIGSTGSSVVPTPRYENMANKQPRESNVACILPNLGGSEALRHVACMPGNFRIAGSRIEVLYLTFFF